MRIDVFLTVLTPGGAERVLVHLARQWKSEGHQVRFVLGTSGGVLLGEARKHAQVIELGSPSLVQAIGPLRRHLRRDPPDALITSLTNSSLVALAAVRLARYRGPVVVRQSGQIVRQEPYQGWFRRALIKRLATWAYPKATAVVAVSKGVLDGLLQVVPSIASRAHVIPNPVAMDRIAYREHGPPATEALLVTACRLDPVKRLDLLLQAMALVRMERPVRLHILGDGPMRSELEVHCHRLGLDDAVTFMGFQPDPSPWIRDADLYVSASDFEGWPNALMESLACGTPVVATDCPSGPREILEDGALGCLVPCGDAEALAQGILKTLQRPPESQALRAHAQKYDVAIIAAWYMELFQGDPSATS